LRFTGEGGRSDFCGVVLLTAGIAKPFERTLWRKVGGDFLMRIFIHVHDSQISNLQHD
jgi:hypothetical protein